MSTVFAAALRVGAACALAWAIPSGPARSHDGHSHGDDPPALSTRATAPRAEAASGRHELVAALRGRDLVFHLDALATNAPVTDAVIAVSTPDGRRKAAILPDGSYRLPAPWLAQDGHHDLLVAVTAEGSTDILSLGLAVPVASEQAEAPVPSLAERLETPSPAVTAAGGFLLGLAAMALFRRRGNRTVAGEPA